MPMVRPGVHMSLISIVKPGTHMSVVTIVIPCIHMIAAMTLWIRKASRTLPSQMVRSAINATVATLTLAVKICIGTIAISTRAFTVSIAIPTYLFFNPISLSIHPFGRTVLGHGRGKHYCYQQNTCTGNYFFHSNFLLFNELDFRAMYWLRRMKIELVYKDMERFI